MSVITLLAKDTLDLKTEMSYSVCTGNLYNIMHTHDYFEITLVTRGSVTHIINDTAVSLSSNAVVFIRPQDRHCFQKSETKDSEYINIAFSERIFNSLFLYFDDTFYMEQIRDSEQAPTFYISADESPLVKENIDSLSLISESGNSVKEKMYLRSLVVSLFFSYYKYELHSNIHLPKWMKKLIIEMNKPENFSEGISRLESISGKTSAHISRVFKEYLHTTPTDYINEIRLRYCAGKLLHSDDEILDIAMDAGFNNLSHFYHLFKKKYSASPGIYRKQNSELYRNKVFK